MKRAIFLDRDNTIIVNDGDLGDPARVKLIQGAASAIASMRGLGYLVVVISNQGGVARGAFTEKDVKATNQRIAELLHKSANGAVIERFYYCPFHPDGTVPGYRREHPWRKPQPGMLLQAAEDLKLDLSECWVVGDQMRDIEAGSAAGVQTVLLAEATEAMKMTQGADIQPDFIARNLIESARLIAQHPRQLPGETAGRASTPRQTYPARQNLGQSRHTGAKAPAQRASRPFKPWEIQPHAEPDAEGQAETAGESPPVESAPVAAEPSPDAIPEQPTASIPAPAPQSPVPPKASSLPDEPTEEPRSNTERLLEQVYRQLKRQDVEFAEWSSYKLLGLGIAQPLVIATALVGLFMSGSHDSMMAWLTGAVLGQLFVIAMLILHGHR